MEGTGRLRTAGFIGFGRDIEPFAAAVSDLLGFESSFYDSEDSHEAILAAQPDILFFGPEGDPLSPLALEGCRLLRRDLFQQVALLVTDSSGSLPLSTSVITAAGFDNHIPLECGAEDVGDAVGWALINRRRRNKYTLQFDGNPDYFCIVDGRGRVVEINMAAAEGSGLSPKQIVRKGHPACEIPSLRDCMKLALPLLEPGQVGRGHVFTLTEGTSVFELKINIDDMPTLGLVAVLRKNDITQTIYTRSLDILLNSVHMLSERDQYTAGHSARVLHYCMHVAQTLGQGTNRRFMWQLFHAALLHDIGKVGVRDSILLKPGRLDVAETRSLCTHPVKGYKLLRHFDFLRDTLDLIRFHHERPDGRGYPDKLRRNRIPLGAAIIAVADTFDAMTTNRPYRQAPGYERAVREIADCRGTQFDQAVAEAFLSQMSPDMHQKVCERSRRPLAVTAKEVFDRL